MRREGRGIGQHAVIRPSEKRTRLAGNIRRHDPPGKARSSARVRQRRQCRFTAYSEKKCPLPFSNAESHTQSHNAHLCYRIQVRHLKTSVEMEEEAETGRRGGGAMPSAASASRPLLLLLPRCNLRAVLLLPPVALLRGKVQVQDRIKVSVKRFPGRDRKMHFFLICPGQTRTWRSRSATHSTQTTSMTSSSATTTTTSTATLCPTTASTSGTYSSN